MSSSLVSSQQLIYVVALGCFVVLLLEKTGFSLLSVIMREIKYPISTRKDIFRTSKKVEVKARKCCAKKLRKMEDQFLYRACSMHDGIMNHEES
jgi:hypothetical protein